MNNIAIHIKIEVPEELEEEMDLTNWVILARYFKKMLESDGMMKDIEKESKRYAKKLQEEKERDIIRAQKASLNDGTNKSLARKAEEEQALGWAIKVLKGECLQREAEAQSGISRFKIAKAMNKIISANGGENPFKQYED